MKDEIGTGAFGLPLGMLVLGVLARAGHVLVARGSSVGRRRRAASNSVAPAGPGRLEPSERRSGRVAEPACRQDLTSSEQVTPDRRKVVHEYLAAETKLGAARLSDVELIVPARCIFLLVMDNGCSLDSWQILTSPMQHRA